MSENNQVRFKIVGILEIIAKNEPLSSDSECSHIDISLRRFFKMRLQVAPGGSIAWLCVIGLAVMDYGELQAQFHP